MLLLEDDCYIHIEFQSTSSRKDLYRFSMYDFQLYKRDGRAIKTIIIYTAEVKKAERSLYMGSLRYKPDQVMKNQYNGDIIFKEVETKVISNEELTDLDMMN